MTCARRSRSEEHTSELQSRTLISYAVLCLKKKKRRGRTCGVALVAVSSPCACAWSRHSFFFTGPATTEFYTSVHTLSLHDALPISAAAGSVEREVGRGETFSPGLGQGREDPTRSEEHTSELQSRTLISYAVFC